MRFGLPAWKDARTKAFWLFAATITWNVPFAIAQSPAPLGAMTLTLQTAQRSCGSEEARERALPDQAGLGRGSTPPLRCRYRLSLVTAGAPLDRSIYIPGLIGHARIEVNGTVVSDRSRDPMARLPRGGDRIVLIEVPDAAWRTGLNHIDIELSAPQWLGLARVSIGAAGTLEHRRRMRVFGVVDGPLAAATVVGTLGICCLLLWVRRRDSLLGYFGVAILGWAIHTVWTVIPWSPLSGDHQVVWWTSLYTFFVVMLVIFCVRFADWRWPRFERLLWVMTLGSPVVLYAAIPFERLDLATDVLRLGLIGIVGIGLVAVLRACRAGPTKDRVLVAASSTVSLAFAVHDWLENEFGHELMPVYLVPYAGLVFFVFVVRMLIARFGQMTELVEGMNVQLRRKVEAQGAELRVAIENMRESRDAAEAADRAKSRFLAAASHDLRQPAHALSLYMAALRGQPLGPAQADLVERMSGSLSAMETMFNLLSDVSRADTGAITPHPRAFPLSPLLSRLATEFAPQAEAQGLRFGLRLPDDADACVESDPLLVEQILRNLLANAVKYTERGGVLFACRLRHTAQGAGQPADRTACWRVEVWDTGVGIAESNRQRVFEEYFQVGNTGRDRSKGLGLGLAFVRRLTTLLGLELTLCSRLGRGSCFALQLPMMAAPIDLPSPSSRPVDLPAIAGMTVGVIEDDLEVRDAMRTLLHHWGCTVVEGADADELKAQTTEIEGTLPQALLVDRRLEHGKSGPAEASALFAHWQTRVPVLEISGDANDDATGDYAVLTKPVSPVSLKAWLGAVREGKIGAGAPPASANPAGELT